MQTCSSAAEPASQRLDAKLPGLSHRSLQVLVWQNGSEGLVRGFPVRGPGPLQGRANVPRTIASVTCKPGDSRTAVA